MNKTLIIYAHPNVDGHCPRILKEVKERLDERKADYEVIDLYSIKYDPVLHENELYSSGNRDVSKQNKEFQGKIKEADNLIFIYPNWWNDMPAMLKGFIDRVFVAGFAFEYEKGRPRGLLKGKKAAVFLTTGSPKWIFKIFEGSRAKKIISGDVLRFCGIKSEVFHIDKSHKIDEKRIMKIKKSVEKGLKYLNRG